MTVGDMLTWVEHRSVLLIGVVFTLIVVTTYWPGRKRAIEDNGMIPFREAPPQDKR